MRFIDKINGNATIDDFIKLESAYETLKSDVDKMEKEIRSLKSEMSSKQYMIVKTIEELNSYANDFKNARSELMNLEEGIPPLKEQLEEAKHSYDNIYDSAMQAKKEEFERFLKSANNDNSIIRTLGKYTETVNMLDNYCESEKQFLIIRDHFKAYNGNLYCNISLIMSPYYYDIDADWSCPTMTELKQNREHTITYIKCERMKSLLEQIKLVLEKYPNSPKGEILVFDRPCVIGGQTSSNRTGYGSEWYSGELVWEGTLYGEVSHFMIGGIIVGGTGKIRYSESVFKE